MKRNFLLSLLMFTMLLFCAVSSMAQSAMLDIPRDSQHATVLQKVGITDIKVNYHRPLVKGRTIWGKVVPYDAVWRAGANENTTISFSDPVSIEGKPLDAGTYGLHMIPGEKEWIALLAKVITAERECCPFLRFELTAEPNLGPVTLSVTGPVAAKPFLKKLLCRPGEVA